MLCAATRLKVTFLPAQALLHPVDAVCSYEVKSGHTIALSFDAANVGMIQIDPTLEAIIAPALLPRGTLQLMILQAFRQVGLSTECLIVQGGP